MTVWDDTGLDKPSLTQDSAPEVIAAFEYALSLARGDGFYVNVQDPRYGAIDDNSTDNAAAIQAALNATPVGGTLVFPFTDTGKYVVGSTLTRTAGIRLWTPVAREVYLKAAAGVDIIDFAIPGSNAVIQIENLSFEGGLDAITISAAGGYLSNQSHLRNVFITGPAGNGIDCAASLVGQFIDQVNVENPGAYGCYLHGAFTNAVVLAGYRCASSDTAGLYITNAGAATRDTAVTLINPVIESNLGVGLRFNQTTAVVINPYFESNGQTAGAADIQMDSDGASSPRTDITVLTGWFGPPHVNQASVRIRATDDFVTLRLIGTAANGSPIYDGGGFTNGMQFIKIGCQPDWTATNLGVAGARYDSASAFAETLIATYLHGYEHHLLHASNPAGIAGRSIVFSRINGGGKSEVCVKHPTGAVEVLSTEP